MASTTRVTITGTAGGTTHARLMHGRAGRRSGLALGAVLAASAMTFALGAPATSAATATGAPTLLTVQGSALSPDAAAAWVTSQGGQVLAVYDVADALLVTLPAGVTPPAGAVSVADVPMHMTAAPTATAASDVKGATYRATIGASSSATGAGVTVAVVDTGVADVADLAGRLTHVNVSGGAAGDGLGHGTFMAGLVAGDGSSSGGAYTGVAPGASILDVQVATADGSTSLSRVLAGLQAVADAAKADPSVRVVSLALSTGDPLPPSADPLSRALDRLWAKGLTVVVSAGNDGPADDTVTSPGADPTLITVGALDEHGTSARSDDTVADFSSRGSRFGASKPDLVAPGVSLVSTRSAGSTADVENPASRVGDSYFTGSGTSMSEAVTAGAAAVLLGTRPALTPDSVKRLLVKTAYDNSALEKADGAGDGALDLAAAVAAAPTAKLVQAKRSVAKLADDRYGPNPADAAAWQQFSDAWAAGDLEAVAAIWVTLSEQTRRWAATAFSLAMLAHNAGTDSAEFAALEALARRWSTEGWNARRWSTDAWVARRWSSGDWDARRWSFADFAARRWSSDDWSARRWSDAAWDARRWSDAEWDARRWSETDWLAFAWVARRWSSVEWASASWDEQAWSARRWSEQTWSDFAWDARRWSTSTWDARRWSAVQWTESV